jgi:hypothetical protein
MAVQMKVHKVNALPGTLEPSTMYMVKSGVTGLMDIYVSSNDGTEARHIISRSEIQAMVNESVASTSHIYVVADIAARNALAPEVVTQALVIDATSDTSVIAGAATYVFDPALTTWTKISEHESMDVVLTWASIQNRPNSTVVEIDDAVGKRHVHANSALLDKVGEDANGLMTYNGASLHAYLSSDQW